MSEHHQQPRWDAQSRQGNQNDSDRTVGSGGPARDEPGTNRAPTRPSVAPVAYQLEKEGKDPAPTPPQAISTFARNVIVATVGASAAFIVFGITRSLSLSPPDVATQARVHAAKAAVETEALQDLVSEGTRMSLSPMDAKQIADRANARARMSLLQPVEPAPGWDPLPVQKASGERSTEVALVDSAAEAATLRCLNASEVTPKLRVHVLFAPEGRVASVDFEGGASYSSQTLSCVEEVFCELVIPGVGSERTFVRDLGGW